MSKSKTLVAASLFVLSGAVFAQEATEFPIDFGPSQVTRAQVRAELAAAQAGGLLSFGEAGHVFRIGPSVLSRRQVAAETLEAIRLGLVPAGNDNPRIATAEEERLIRVAGERAVQTASLAK